MKSQRNMTKMKEKEVKKKKKKLSELEISKLHDRDFRLIIVKMIQDLGNKLEVKIDKL